MGMIKHPMQPPKPVLVHIQRLLYVILLTICERLFNSLFTEFVCVTVSEKTLVFQTSVLFKIKKVMFHSEIMQVLIKSLFREPSFSSYISSRGGGTG